MSVHLELWANDRDPRALCFPVWSPARFFFFKPEHRSSVLGGRWYCGSARARQMIDQDNEHVKKMPRFSAMSD